MIDSLKTVLRIPDNIIKDTLSYRDKVYGYVQGETSFASFRACRVPMGIYEERSKGQYMVRVRIPSGMALPHQVEKIASLSKAYGNGTVHVTTRQDFQIHGLRIEDTPDVVEKLLEVGLSPRGGGGNTVRNVTACPRAGVCPDEEFDVSGYSVALSEYLLSNNSSFNLPRKFKIAFSGCPRDCAFASVADLGFFAHEKGGMRGFAVYAGGGLGAHPRVGIKIENFVPEARIFYVAEAVKRLFDMHGDRTNKHQARLRYVLKRLGQEEFLRQYRNELRKILSHDLANIAHKIPEVYDLRSRLGLGTNSINPLKVGNRVSLKNTFVEKNPGFYSVELHLKFGEVPANDLQKISQMAENFGEGLVRTTQSQNLLICGVEGERVNQLFSALKGLTIDVINGGRPEIVTCTGASTCKLGLCLSQGLAEEIMKNLSREASSSRFRDIAIRISGCPNSCGQHYIGDIGLQGNARRVNGKLMPFYDILFGADIREGYACLSEKIGSLPAKSVPIFISDILEGGSPVTSSQVKILINRYNESQPDKLPSEYYYDFGAALPFSLAGRGPGECGAGVMDVIQLDIDEAKEALKTAKTCEDQGGRDNSLYQALLSVARALLITRGLEPQRDREVFDAFIKHLVEPGWVKPKVRQLVNEVVDRRIGDGESINERKGEIEELINRIEELFHSLDANLNFRLKPVKNIATSAKAATAVHFVDLQGVSCPLNFVKAKLALENINRGEILEILLDDGEPVRNVPASFQEQGQEVMEIKKIADHFCIKVRRIK